ncbi:beta 1-4 rhamnosyltransferase Cps2T [Changpingibacter yushuensis]|uniref:beta 1-4 rhamnosyltransferase Cps2T n=1 Tax=Changpingibacter yushuensis TaxID=2758440 RepID=UPI00165E5479|nr:DUF1972 domain-containing protein [Changpingibacter yushuensis]
MTKDVDLVRNVFIVGSKGIPAAYGGYETFVDRLTGQHEHDEHIRYHVACKGHAVDEYEYNGARCFQVKVPDLGSAQAIYYDVAALLACLRYVKKNQIECPIVYILACRIGPVIALIRWRVHKLGGTLLVNPDGWEWKRTKWSALIRRYWKLSEKLMVRSADLIVCDSKTIEAYINDEYRKLHPNTKYISYGAEVHDTRTMLSSQDVRPWFTDRDLTSGSYYLIVGRFVPENNYEVAIREFIQSQTTRKLVIITDPNSPYYEDLKKSTGFESDSRIIFAGTVYDQTLLAEIRRHAFAYLHGHEVGGTNPSLLEALGSTRLNLLLDVGFNREVAQDGALYWNKRPGNLSALIQRVEDLEEKDIDSLAERAKNRIATEYTWELIADRYKELFLSTDGR